jgi:hypothetical protein
MGDVVHFLRRHIHPDDQLHNTKFPLYLVLWEFLVILPADYTFQI